MLKFTVCVEGSNVPLGLAVTNCVSSGRMSRIIPTAGVGPRFFALIMNVSLPITGTEGTAAWTETARSMIEAINDRGSSDSPQGRRTAFLRRSARKYPLSMVLLRCFSSVPAQSSVNILTLWETENQIPPPSPFFPDTGNPQRASQVDQE